MSALLPTYARSELSFAHGEGAYLFTVAGERYLDFASGVIVAADAFFSGQGPQLAASALAQRLATISLYQDHVSAGCLMNYGQNVADFHQRAARYVDKILKGAKPEDLPVEQPTKFDLVINKKTADLLGLAIPLELLVSADRVIE